MGAETSMPEKIDTTCTRCGAPFAKRLSVIYSDGLTTVSGQSQASSKMNTIGGHKATTTTASSGVQQTAASRAAAPPPMPAFVKGHNEGLLWTILIAGFFLTFVLAFAIVQSFILSPLVLIGGLFFSFFFARLISEHPDPSPEELAAWKAANAEQIKAAEDWKETFECGSCGNRFVVKSGAS